MKLQELLKERERIDKELEKYESEMRKLKELQNWQNIIKKSLDKPFPTNPWGGLNISIPDHIRTLFLNALQSEIDKLEKE